MTAITYISVCFSHDLQRDLGGGQPFGRHVQFPSQAGDLSLFSSELADLRTGRLAVECTGIALLAPLADQR